MALSLQDRFSPGSICFGCGPANVLGLRLQSHVQGEQLVAQFVPLEHHQAFPGVINGGIIGTLLDCHCNWAAAWHLMKRLELTVPPGTVTAEYTIRMEKPTPIGEPLLLASWATDFHDRRATTEGTIATLNGTVTARCRGLFVAVKEGHPAFNRW
ncbi:MAG TPA: PaaI family thioesterase [Pirellulaceae bacterium]|nr:PaaI family thioesterase [Pirellulaceae bacterium]